MGALDAHAQRAASDAQTAARMTNGSRDNVWRLATLFSVATACAHGVEVDEICLDVPARVALLTDVMLVHAMGGLVIFVPVCTCLFASRPSCVALYL